MRGSPELELNSRGW